MKLGFRFKLMGLLTAVALLPMLAALVGMVIGTTNLRSETFGQTIRAVAASEARALEVSLTKDIEKLQVVLQGDDVAPVLARLDEKLPEAKLKKIDGQWRSMSDTEEPLRSIMRHPVLVPLRRVQEADPRIVKILLTDRHGQTVASTVRPDDFYQADEDWWQGAGKGKVYIPPIDRDPSTHLWSINLCMPITDGNALVGVAKVVIDVSRWLGGMTRLVGRMSADVMLVHGDGRIIYRTGVEPMTTTASHWSGPIAEGKTSSWRVTPGGEIQAFAPIALPQRVGPYEIRMPMWVLVLYMPESVALGPLYRLIGLMLIVGLVVIAVIFVGGLLLVERGPARRISQLQHATHQVAGGDLAHRIKVRRGSWGLFGGDEIDDLAYDFNRMIERVQRSYEELSQASELKSKFIRVASHELRTPVAYILGMARLLKDCADPGRLSLAIRAVGDRAGRLEGIIQAMFKLLPDQAAAQELQLGAVSLPELAEEIRQGCLPFLERRSQRLVVEDPGGLPLVQADREKVADVLENLVMNAIKFSPDGSLIRVVLGKDLTGGVEIAVHDQGPGVPEAELPHIFEPFYSGGDVLKHSSGTVEYQKRGIGLGLAIVKHFVELHGGKVSVRTSSSGSAFTVSLPQSPPRRGGADGGD